MSVVLLKELYSEVSRLYIAGSDLAAGDFRLKRLVPGLLQAGEKVPVFKKLGESTQELAEPAERDGGTAAARLQELTLLLSSVLHTQGAYAPEAEGELRELEIQPLGLPTDQSYRRLSEVIEALGTTGSGRHEIVVQAYKDGLFQDLRLVQPAVHALNDPYAELADYARDVILPAYGRAILPLLRAGFDPEGGKADARTVEVLAKLAATDEDWTLVHEAADQGSTAVRVAAIPYLAGRPAFEEDIIRWTSDSKKAVRAVAYTALARSSSERAQTRLYEAMGRADANLVADALFYSKAHPLTPRLAKDAAELLEGALTADGKLTDEPKAAAALQDKLPMYWRAINGKDDEESHAVAHQLLDAAPALYKIDMDHILHDAAYTAAYSPSLDVLAKLRRLEKLHPNFLSHSYTMARELMSPQELYEAFSGYDRGVYKDELVSLMEKELASKAWQPIESTWEGNPSYGYVATLMSEAEVIKGWDFRWLPWALTRKKPILVAMLASKSRVTTDVEAEDIRIAEIFLLEELEKTFKDYQEDFTVLWEGLQRCGADPALCRETMLRGLEKPKRLRYYLSNEVFFELKRLPASYRDRLTALLPKADHEAARQLQVIIDHMSEVQA